MEMIGGLSPACPGSGSAHRRAQLTAIADETTQATELPGRAWCPAQDLSQDIGRPSASPDAGPPWSALSRDPVTSQATTAPVTAAVAIRPQTVPSPRSLLIRPDATWPDEPILSATETGSGQIPGTSGCSKATNRIIAGQREAAPEYVAIFQLPSGC